MSLILVEVFTYSGKSICESGLSVHDSHSLQSQNYLHATYSGGSIHDKPLRYVLIPVICMLATPVMSRCDLTRLHLDKIFFFKLCTCTNIKGAKQLIFTLCTHYNISTAKHVSNVTWSMQSTRFSILVHSLMIEWVCECVLCVCVCLCVCVWEREREREREIQLC